MRARLIVVACLAAAGVAACGPTTGGGPAVPSPPVPSPSVASPFVPSLAGPLSVPLPTSLPTGLPDLRGRTVVIDQGHDGGNAADPAAIGRQVDAGGFWKECDTVGASTDAGYPEHAFTFDVAQRTAALLRARGARVVLTRPDDRGVGPCVDERAAIGNREHADVAVSIHADGGPADGSGFHVIAPALSPDGGNSAILAASMTLATGLRVAFAHATGERTANYVAVEGVDTRSDLGGLNLSRVPKVFIECANMRNAGDAAKVSDPAWRDRAAAGIARGIEDFLGR